MKNLRGEVKWFNPKRNYGFIEPSEGEKDCYVHGSEIDQEDYPLRDGDLVEFDVEETEKGLRALNVKKVAP